MTVADVHDAQAAPSRRRSEALQAKFLVHLTDELETTATPGAAPDGIVELGQLLHPGDQQQSEALETPVDTAPARRFPTIWRKSSRGGAQDPTEPTRSGSTSLRWEKEHGRAARGMSSRGWLGDGATGRTSWVEPPLEWRGTSVQVCGLWPWGAGTGTPNAGTPIGKRIGSGPASGETVHCDPIAWFQAGLITSPSEMVMGLNGRGKSSFVRRQLLGMSARGIRPMVLGDSRPDYVNLTRAIGGQVIRAGRGVGTINPLDPGAMAWAATKLSGEAKATFVAELRGRQTTMMCALLEVVRKEPLKDYEEAAVAALVMVINERNNGVPLPHMLLDALQERPEGVRAALVDNGEDDVYTHMTAPLLRTMNALLNGPFGDVFSGHNSEAMSLDAPGVCIDVSSIPETDQALLGAALLASWNHGFGTIRAMQELSDAGLMPFVHYCAVLDEFWKALRSGPGMAGRVDQITRLDREGGYGRIIITHTVKDAESLPLDSDRAIARGFVERSGIVATCASTKDEMRALSNIVPLTRAEQREVTSWATVKSYKTLTGTASDAKGKGQFLLKVGERPGVPVQVQLTPCEKDINNTNHRWEMTQ